MDKEIKPDLYICSYGQTGIPVCVDACSEYCKYKFKDKKCDFKPIVKYEKYKDVFKQLKQLERGKAELIKSAKVINDDCMKIIQKNKTLMDALEGINNVKYGGMIDFDYIKHIINVTLQELSDIDKRENDIDIHPTLSRKELLEMYAQEFIQNADLKEQHNNLIYLVRYLLINWNSKN